MPSVRTLGRCVWLGKRFATVWNGWGSNSPRNSFRFCRAKLVIGWPFCSARSAPCSIVGARLVTLSNLRVAFGDEISAEGRAQIVRESYQHFCRTMLDFFGARA